MNNYLYMIKINGKYGFINKNGEIIIDPIYSDADYFSDGLAYVKEDSGRKGYINEKNEFLFEISYDRGLHFSNGYAEYCDINGKSGYIDKIGKEVISAKFDVVYGFNEFGTSIVKINKLFGVIDTSGNYIIEPKFQILKKMSNGLMPAKKNNKYGFIDINENVVIDYKYDNAISFSEGLAGVQLEVLKYKNAFNELDVYITSGFTNTSNPPSPIKIDNCKPSGYGYELMVFSEPGDVIFGKELVAWAQYIDTTKNHIFQGQWLAYKEDLIPGTSLAGFIILNPLEFPNKIPVGDGYGLLNMFMGVTKKEIALARKKDDIYVIAKKIFKSNYVNYSPINRNSVV